MSESASPALAAYQEISVLRNKHAQLIWGDKDASPGELRALLEDLDTGLSKLSTPLNTDLAEGNVYLRFRRVNFLIDKILVLERLDDPAAAIRAWQDLQQIAWFDLTQLSPSDVSERFRRLLDRPEAAGIRAQVAASARWSEDGPVGSTYLESIPIEERIAGLSKIWAVARDAFVWFDRVPDLDWDRAYVNAIPRVMATEKTEEYYRELMRFVALLRDSHCNVYPPKELAECFYSRPGVQTAKVEGRVIVMEVTDGDLSQQGLRAGDEVLRIEGIDVEDYAQKRVAPYQSSPTEQDAERRTYSYGLLAGPAEHPVRLEIRGAGGRYMTLVARRSGYAKGEGRRVSFAMRGDGVAVVVTPHFESDAAAELLGQHIEKVVQAKGLILDLRDNGGGSSGAGFALLSWLGDAPLPSMSSAYREHNALERARMGKRAFIAWRNLERNEFGLQRNQVFRGPVALLIDAGTHSAAEDTAAVFRLMRRGIIVGRTSAGGTGQPWLFGLPGGGTARICVKRDCYPDGTTFVGTGIVPDIHVPLKIEDVREGKDFVLERAVRELLTR
jgi:C-terminal processing protease CtpA/Prc